MQQELADLISAQQISKAGYEQAKKSYNKKPDFELNPNAGEGLLKGTKYYVPREGKAKLIAEKAAKKKPSNVFLFKGAGKSFGAFVEY